MDDFNIILNDPIIQTINNRKRKQLDRFNPNNLPSKNPFLPKPAQELQNNKDIFDTLSDVSTDDSDIQITHVSGNLTPIKKNISKKANGPTNVSVINLDSDNDIEYQSDISKLSIDYLISTPDCHVIREVDYLKLGLASVSNTFNSCSSHDEYDSDNSVQINNDVCFVIDDQPSSKKIDNTSEIDSIASNNTSELKKKRKRKSQKRFPNNPELQSDQRMFKYWSQRYELFERFDMGIKLDKESWYSVTAEYIAKEQSEICLSSDTVLDGFCGAGGNTIQFAYKCRHVFAFDIDSIKVELTKNNCQVYGVTPEKVSIMKNDFYAFAQTYRSTQSSAKSVIDIPKIDVVFLSPPWGGQDYLITKDCSGNTDYNPINVARLLETARVFDARLIMIYLPRNTDESFLLQLAAPKESLQLIRHESRYKKTNCHKIKAITAIYRVNI